ncbi:MAG: helix-turn-helix domain-containing protein [Candidatus Altiarchaeota archaeon]
MKLPCEYAIWYVLPDIRAEIARELIALGLDQKEAAQRLGVTPAAVSQYIHKKRGGKSRLPKTAKGKIKKAAKRIKDSRKERDILKVICETCMSIRT